jgi:hypothetical protein
MTVAEAEGFAIVVDVGTAGIAAKALVAASIAPPKVVPIRACFNIREPP